MDITLDDVLSGLNEQQKEAVLDIYGPSYVIAGAGSGKTKTMISRMLNLLYNGIKPYNILLFTFTNKAAGEIKERALSAIGEEASSITAGTYHSVCAKVIRRFVDTIGYTSNFTIIDQDDSISILTKLLNNEEIPNKMLFANYINSMKEHLKYPSECLKNAKNQEDLRYANVYADYQRLLKKQNIMDFNDILFNTVKILENNYDALCYCRNKFKFIMSDESQDCSFIDNRIIQLLAGDDMNVCYFFDNDQSIYGFRGADVNIVLNLDKYYPNITPHLLERNYRSTQTIVNAANSVVANNIYRIDKKAFSENDQGNPIMFFQEDTPLKEAERVCAFVRIINEKYGVEYSDIAILYRMNSMSESLEKAFVKNNMPYRIHGGLNFYSRKEIKDILSYLKLYYNPNDYTAFERCINTPTRGIGKTSVEKIHDYADEYNVDYITACKNIELKGKTAVSLKKFVTTIEKLKRDKEPHILVSDLIEDIRYIPHIEKDIVTFEEKNENIKELVNIVSDYSTLDDFLAESSLISRDSIDDNNKVTFMSMHASKGLEYKAVFLYGVIEGIMPSWRAKSLSDIEEERRLMYVAMTRAKEYLFISRPVFAKKNASTYLTNESRFIKEINKKYIQRLN